jgi:hypothetical protein
MNSASKCILPLLSRRCLFQSGFTNKSYWHSTLTSCSCQSMYLWWFFAPVKSRYSLLKYHQVACLNSFRCQFYVTHSMHILTFTELNNTCICWSKRCLLDVFSWKGDKYTKIYTFNGIIFLLLFREFSVGN